MFEQFFTSLFAYISIAFAAIPFSTATWFLLGILLFFIWLFTKAHRDPNSKVDWQDLILDPVTERVTPFKLGYLIGVIVSTWVVVKFTDGDKLTWDILGGYLAYLLGGAGWIASSQSRSGAPTAPSVPVAPKIDDIK